MKSCSKNTKKKSSSTTQDSDARRVSRVAKTTSVIRLPSKQADHRTKYERQEYPRKQQTKEEKQPLKQVTHHIKQPTMHPHSHTNMSHRLIELQNENKLLKEKYCALEHNSLTEKEKVKRLLMRVNELKSAEGSHHKLDALFTLRTNQSNAQLQTPLLLSRQVNSSAKLKCSNGLCEEQRRRLEQALYKERLSRDKLEIEKREWEKNKNELKAQYNDLLSELREMREGDFL